MVTAMNTTYKFVGSKLTHCVVLMSVALGRRVDNGEVDTWLLSGAADWVMQYR
jgi:hypothetical protein